jgi:rare lipoprotein A
VQEVIGPARAISVALAALLLVAGCGGTRREPDVPADRKPLRVERGKASYYGSRHHGGPTASGERYDKRAFTAAHRKLRFNAVVRVTNRRNGKAVVVRINDRGPFGNRSRVIDLSEAAARKLDMLRSGVVPVTIEVLEEPPPRPKKKNKRRRNGPGVRSKT